MSRKFVAVCSALVSLCTGAVTVGFAANQHISPSSPDFPGITLPQPARGTAAIDALGARLPALAQAYGMTAEELRQRFIQDRHLNVDRRGRLYYADEFGVPQNAATVTESAPAALAPLSDTFTLHSRPGSKRVVYLDFNGDVLSGTAWNAGFNNGNDIVCPPWDIDGSPSTFGDTERTRIQQIWQRVAEDYAPFDVDVTTEDPGAAAITRSNSSDDVYGMRVLISPISQYFGGGGIAYVGVYDAVGLYYQPALVFPEQLANGEKYIAEACSHECGHTLGLNHDGTTTGTEYYSGQGSGETGWAPIMGVGYYQNFTQWSKGEYPNANNTEDDLAVIQANGLSYRLDDHGNNNNSATFLPAGTAINASGVIERNTDEDVLAFSAGAGTISLTVAPAPLGPNLDVVALLYNAAGTLISSNNPATALTANLNLNVSAGTYYLHVRGTGSGTSSTGYSSYASLGQYTVTGTVPDPTGAVVPVAVASATPTSGTTPLNVAFSGTQSYDQDGTIVAYQWNFGDGATGSGSSVSHIYQNAGSFTATLTVTDNSGLTDSHTVTITTSTPNLPPIAVATASPTNGYTPLTVSFSGSGSSDSDGSIASYQWTFGDGSTGSGVTIQHTYSTVGTFTAKLVVTDNLGATATNSVVVNVQQNPANVVHVSSITLAVVNVAGGKKAQATVKIVGSSGNAISSATVSGQWSGLVSGSSSGSTSSAGTLTLSSGKFKKAGTVTFRVTNVTKSGYTYDATQNAVTQVSVAAAR